MQAEGGGCRTFAAHLDGEDFYRRITGAAVPFSSEMKETGSQRILPPGGRLDPDSDEGAGGVSECCRGRHGADV